MQVNAEKGMQVNAEKGKKTGLMASHTEKLPESAGPNPAIASCRKKKNEEATFLEDVKDHIDEFIHASMDEHKTCFQKTIKKMFGMSKIVADRNAEASKEGNSLPLHKAADRNADASGVESSLPLRTTLSD